jgi:hypothetical protein
VRLDLSGSGIGNEGAESLLAWPGLRHLAELSLDDKPVDAALVREITEIVVSPTG